MFPKGRPDRDNPFVADDVLIKVGVALLLASVFASGLLRQLTSLAVGGPLFLAGLAALVAGYRLRAREREVLRLLSLLERFPEISVAQLLEGSRMKRRDLERAVATVNERGLHYVFWNRESDTLFDGRLVAGSVVVDDCPECGANIGLNVSLANPAAACCPYCRSGLPAAALNDLRQRRLSALDAERAHERELRSRERLPAAPIVVEEKKFNVGLFLVLFVIVPPIGIGYALYGAWRAMR